MRTVKMVNCFVCKCSTIEFTMEHQIEHTIIISPYIIFYLPSDAKPVYLFGRYWYKLFKVIYVYPKTPNYYEECMLEPKIVENAYLSNLLNFNVLYSYSSDFINRPLLAVCSSRCSPKAALRHFNKISVSN